MGGHDILGRKSNVRGGGWCVMCDIALYTSSLENKSSSGENLRYIINGQILKGLVSQFGVDPEGYGYGWEEVVLNCYF